MSRAFPFRADCPISSIGAISGSLIENCTISSVPAPINATPTIPFFPPQSFDFGCFAMPKPSTTFSSAANMELSAWVTYPSGSETNCCEPLFNFFFQMMPGSCPGLAATAEITRPTNVPTPQMIITAEQSGTGCAFDLGFNLQLPCIPFEFPTTLQMSFTNKYAPSAAYRYDWCSCSSSSDHSSAAPQSCQYDVAFNFRLPHPELHVNVTTTKTDDDTRPTPCEDYNIGAGLLVSNIDLSISPAVNPNDPASLILAVTKNVPWICPLGDSNGASAPPEADPCEFYGLAGGGFTEALSTITQDIDCPTKFSWLVNLKKYKIDETQDHTKNTMPRIQSNYFYDIFYGFSQPQSQVGDFKCGAITGSARQFWVPQDEWRVRGSSSTVKYVGGAFDGQLKMLSVVRDIAEEVYNPFIGHASKAQEVDRVTVEYQYMRPFVKGGLTGCYSPLPKLYWFFDSGILHSTSLSGYL